jgi:DNA-nicking Smr family endonuclease
VKRRPGRVPGAAAGDGPEGGAPPRADDGSARDDEARAFAEAMRGARPLPPEERQRRALASLPSHASLATPARAAPRHATPPRAAPEAELAAFDVEDGAASAGRGPGVDARLLRRLKAGDYPVEARLDLHGRSLAHARDALERFVAVSHAQGRRALLLIHGRGAHSSGDGPVLKPMVRAWLATSARASRAVLAFAPARPAQGGDGATLVLLRKPDR